MTTIRVLSLTLALVCSPFVISCSDSKTNSAEQERSNVQAVEDLVAAVKTVELDFAQGFLLKNATDNERTSLQQNLYDIKIATYRLRSDVYDGEALSQLYQAFQGYTTLHLLEDDRARLVNLDQQLRTTLDVVATMQGKTLAGIERVLFEKIFNIDLAPFSSTKVWKIDGNKDSQYALGTGKDDAWLLSPMLDLTQVANPAFVVNQAINERGLPFLPGLLYLVSTNYVSGDPSKATWESLTIQSMPDGSSYNYRKSEPVSLAAYAGKKVVVAFKLDAQKLTFMPANAKASWRIASFQLIGTGNLLTDRLDLVGGLSDLPYKKSFKDTGLTGFTTITSGSTGWEMFTIPGATSECCAKAAGNKTSSWLLSPRFDLTAAQNPEVMFRQAVNKAPDNDSVMNVLVTADTDLSDLSKVNWEKLNFKAPTYNTKFTFEDSDRLSLAKYVGKKVVIAFRYQQGESSSWPTWEVDNMQLLGSGPVSVEVLKRDGIGLTAPILAPAQPAEVEGPVSNVALPYKKTFKDSLYTNFVRVANVTTGWDIYRYSPSNDACCAKVAGSALTAWALSPRYDLSQVQNPEFLFRHAINKAPDNDSVMNILVTADTDLSDLTKVNWEKLNFKAPAYNTKFTFEDSDRISLAKYAGQKIVIAFRYQQGVSTSWPTWEIDNLQILGTGTLSYEPVKGVGTNVGETPAPQPTPTPTVTPTPDPGTPPTPTTGFSWDFTSGLGEFKAISGNTAILWKAFNETNQPICCAAVTSTPRTNNPDTNAYLIRDVDLAGMTDPVLAFDHSVQRAGAGKGDIFAVRIRLAQDAGGAFDANWTDLFSIVASDGGLTAAARATVTKSLKDYAGQKVQIAFFVNMTAPATGTKSSPFWKIHTVSVKENVPAVTP